MGAEIPEWHNVSGAEIDRGEYGNAQVVCGWLAQHALVHKGAVFTMGKGATSSYSRNVKSNTRSLTETEIYTVDMFMPEMLLSLHFIQLQGYKAECVELYQDNISSQLLTKNGKMSSGKKTKYIKAKFFFIKKSMMGQLR